MRRGGSLRKEGLRRMGLDLMGDRGIRSLLVFRRVSCGARGRDIGGCLERQDSGLLAMNFLFPRPITSSYTILERLGITPQAESCPIALNAGYHGINGGGIRQAYGVWIQYS